MFQSLRDLVLANQASLLLAGYALVGYAAYLGRSLWRDARGRVASRFICSLDVPGTQEVYVWLVHWLSLQPYTATCRRLSVMSWSGGARSVPSSPGESSPTSALSYFPAPGIHVLRYKGRWLWLDLRREKSEGYNPWTEELHLSALSRDPSFLRDLVAEARTLALPERDERITVCVPAGYGNEWRVITRILPRPLDSVVLPHGRARAIVDDIEQFLERRDWYQERGVPWHRSYFLHGIPGSGKSSMCKALAGHFHRSIYLLSLSGSKMDDTRLCELLGAVPESAFLVFEDVDAAFTEREATKDAPGLTFSGLLNALDGIASVDGRIMFMTTNHRELLDPALVRPGRADVHVEFAHATDEQIETIYRRYYPTAGDAEARDFADDIRADLGRVSMAQVQERLIAGARAETSGLVGAERGT